MEVINLNALRKINKIIEKDNLSSSYKLALLKAVIFTVNKYDHLVEIENNKVKIPFYFLIEQWFFDYLPFLINKIKQQTNKTASQILNKKIENLYYELFDSFKIENLEWKEIYSLIYYNYNNYKLNDNQQEILLKLFREIRNTIKNNPMKYIGDDYYSIFFDINTPKVNSLDYTKFGYFCIDKEIYQVFRYLGYNLLGLNTILKRWRDFTLSLNPNLQVDDILQFITFDLNSVLRDTNIIRNLFKDNKYVRCVWSGRKIEDYDIDHILPFSIYFNNDIWNLMPSDKKINNKKRDKIPHPKLVEKRKNIIIDYWNLYKYKFDYFDIQREKSLGIFSKEEDYINSLIVKCEFLIDKVGFDYFEL